MANFTAKVPAPPATMSIADMQSQIDIFNNQISLEQKYLLEIQSKYDRAIDIYNYGKDKEFSNLLASSNPIPTASVTEDNSAGMGSGPNFITELKDLYAKQVCLIYYMLAKYLKGDVEAPGYMSGYDGKPESIGTVTYRVDSRSPGTINAFGVFKSDSFQPGLPNMDSVQYQNQFVWHRGFLAIPDIANPILETLTDSRGFDPDETIHIPLNGGRTLNIKDRQKLISDLKANVDVWNTEMQKAMLHIAQIDNDKKVESQTTAIDAVANKSNVASILVVVGLLVGVFVAYKFLFNK